MIADEDPEIEKGALNLVTMAHSNRDNSATDHNCVRQLKVPKINFAAESYIEMVDWETVAVSLPPMLPNLNKDNFEDACECIGR